MVKTLRYLACCMLACLTLNANATVKNITTNSTVTTWTTTDDSYTGTIDGITLTCEKNNGASLGSCASTTYIQVKKGNLLSIEASGETITKVEINCTSAAQKMSIAGTDVDPDGNTLTWTGSTTKFQAENLGTPMKIASIEVTYGAADADTPKAPVFTGAATFTGSTDVTITSEDGTVIYYTTDNTVPTTTSLTNNTNSVTLPLTATTTVQAIAVKDDKVSETATQTFTCLENKTIADLNAIKSDQKNVILTLTNAKIVYNYFNGYCLYVREGDVAIRFDAVAYGKTDYTVNSVINGTIIVDYNNYNGSPAVTGNNLTNFDNLTVTESTEEAQPVATTISELKELKHAEDLIVLSNVTLTSETVKSEYYTYTTYTLTDEDGNTVKCPSIIDSELAAKANDGNKYTVKAIFDSINSNGEPQLTLIGTVGDDTPAKAMTIADLNATTESMTNIKLTLTDAKIVYNAYQGYYIYVREGDVAIRFDGIAYNNTKFSVNSIINGTISVDYNNYNGSPSVASNSDTNLDDLTITESTEEAQPVATTISELKELKHAEDLIVLSNVTLTSETVKSEYYTYTTYTLTDEDGNTVKCPSVLDEDFKTKANDGNKYTVKAIFESINGKGEPQLTVIGTLVSAGINAVNAEDDNAPVYNVAGQKVDAGYKGIVIKNGKKVFNNK